MINKGKIPTNIDAPVTPIDGRYRKKTKILSSYFSEFALVKYRMMIELKYLQKLSQYKIAPNLTKQEIFSINQLIETFNEKDFSRVKEIESEINHDVKAVEYYLREKFSKIGLTKLFPFIHIGLTSEDVSNLAYGLIFNDANSDVIIKELRTIIKILKEMADCYKNYPMLGRTHGQPAVPTTFGKEIANYVYRLQKQYKRISQFRFEGKLNGAVGAMNALEFVYPTVNWLKFSNDFITNLGLTANHFTSQILPSDNLVEYFQILVIINGVMVNLCQDIWTYIMLEELKLKKNEKEVGSSTMPQKVNPIDFENAEGNLQVANSYFQLYQQKLLISRLQRDLSDSTVKRTFGTAIAHMILAWKSLQRGLGKIDLNSLKTKENLELHWEVLAEAIQVYLRSINDDKAYEKVKELTRGRAITKEIYQQICEKLGLTKKDKRFKDLTPEKYIGLAKELVDLIINSKF